MKKNKIRDMLHFTKRELHEALSTTHFPKDNIKETLIEFVNQLSAYRKFEILNVDVKNEGEEFGEEIFSKNTTYIFARLTIAVYEDVNVTFQVKFYDSRGELSTWKNSPIGYSYECNSDLHKHKIEKITLVGWGQKQKGHWNSGNYLIEIWNNDNLLSKKEFIIQ